MIVTHISNYLNRSMRSRPPLPRLKLMKGAPVCVPSSHKYYGADIVYDEQGRQQRCPEGVVAPTHRPNLRQASLCQRYAKRTTEISE